MVNKADAVEIISYADNNGIDIWLDGGWGVDALLETETRAHNDIDLFVEKINRRKFIDIIKEKGFSEIEEAYTTASHTVWKDTKGRIRQKPIEKRKKEVIIIVSVYVLCVAVLTGLHTVSRNSVPRNVKR